MIRRPSTTAEVRQVHYELTRYLFGHFRRKLSLDELHDIAADALAEADRAVHNGQEIEDLQRWLRRTGWRDALDAIRKIEGEGKVPRKRPLPMDDHTERPISIDAEQQLVDDLAALRHDAAALTSAFEELRPDEQRVLRWRYFDELDVEAILGLLGCSRHHYENLHKRGLKKLRNALVEHTADATCGDCRTLVLQGRDAALDGALTAKREAHLAGCLSCRAFSARQSGLIAALPLPALPAADRLLARVQAHFANLPDPSQHAEGLAGSIAVGTGAAAGGTAVAGGGVTLFGLGGAAKTLAVACSAGAVTAACLPVLPQPDRPEKQRPVAQVAKPKKSPKARPAAAVAAAPLAEETATARAVTEHTSAPPTAKPRPTRAARERQRAAAREKARRDASPFLPESAAPPVTSQTAQAPVAQTASANPDQSASAPAETADFSSEFTP